MSPVSVKTAAEIESMRKSGRILTEVLGVLRTETHAGVTTGELNKIAEDELSKRSAKGAFKGYNGFPAALCVSVNEQVVHGIPGDRTIKDGDIVGLDIGVVYEGMITDGAITVPVGPISTKADQLLKGTEQALEKAVSVIRAGARVGDVSSTIGKHLKASGLNVVRDLSGHGVGRSVHEEPEIHNEGNAGTGPELLAGMTIAVEPMACLGDPHIRVLEDGWTIATRDSSLAAQFEHTILVTEDGAEVLTQA